MYGIIFWEDDSTVKPVLNKDGTLTTFDSIKEADKQAEMMLFQEWYHWKA